MFIISSTYGESICTFLCNMTLQLVIRSPPIGVEKFNYNQFQYFITLDYITIMDANVMEFIYMNVHP